MTWGTEIQKVEQGVTSVFKNGKSVISDIFGGISRKITEVQTFFKNGGTTVVGINVNQIPAMKTAIREYVATVDSALDELKNYDPTVAFKGEEIVLALKEYIDAVKEACSAITSNMLAFNDKLTEVQIAYEKKDSHTASQIKSSAESTRQAYTKYSELGGGVTGGGAMTGAVR